VPQLVVLALLGAGAYACYRWIARASRELAAELRRNQEELQRGSSPRQVERDLGSLEYDPKSGVYRPAKRG
jgi:type II secretory pathway component PulJ